MKVAAYNVKIILDGDFMSSIKIMHCADLHLGAELSTLGNRGSERRAELLHTLNTIKDLCRENAVRLLLIAGDLFDSNNVSKDTVQSVKSCFASMDGVLVAVTPGNHDYLSADSPYNSEWSKNVHIFKKAETIEVDGVFLHSVPFLSAYSDTFSLPCAEDGTNILLLHGDTSGGNYNPITPAVLAQTNMDYVALGHVHKRTEIAYAGTTAYAYSGCPEPLGFDELDEKGVYIGTVDKNQVNLKFYRTCRRCYRELTLDVSEAQDNTEVLNLAKSIIKNYNGDLIKLKLTGESGFSVDTEYVAAGLKDDAYFIKVRDCTFTKENLEVIKEEQTLKGFFVREMLSRLEHCDEEKKTQLNEALRLGLAALSSREVGYLEN